ncbi:hypothetical protein [Gelidibacter maritimus]|uniref:Uncharacterized protein n=1 Tax=Gelidibacter maritimus TaxID=2761487 RepID=A0A7W2R287_9FLAO|nr:hypothetical protein [Gelidibacter maritimus]MBA6151527.1 hypothetical protein [Gelidibacter maritimus]
MPDDIVALLVRFLEQNKGTLSNRAKEKEFKRLSTPEIADVEENYKLFLQIDLIANYRLVLAIHFMDCNHELKWFS